MTNSIAYQCDLQNDPPALSVTVQCSIYMSCVDQPCTSVTAVWNKWTTCSTIKCELNPIRHGAEGSQQVCYAWPCCACTVVAMLMVDTCLNSTCITLKTADRHALLTMQCKRVTSEQAQRATLENGTVKMRQCLCSCTDEAQQKTGQ